MIKVSVISTAGRKTDMFAEHQTPREILEHFSIDYSVATNTIDGVRLGIGDMDKSLRDLGVADECRISSIVKIDNAASIELNGAAAVLTSGVKLEDWKLVEKYAPEGMKIVDEDGETLFKVMTSDGTGSINEYGVCFGSYVNADGYATVTILLDEDVEDKKAALKETVGRALLDLNVIENEIPDVVKEVQDKDAEIDQYITVK